MESQCSASGRDVQMPSYEGPNSDEYEDGKFPSVSCSMSWTSLGPPETIVPMSALCSNSPWKDQRLDEQSSRAGYPAATSFWQQQPGRAEQREQPNHALEDVGDLRNPIPDSGSRRDACGCLSIGSEGHDLGKCAGPCKDLRSGRGCTFRKCKLCHLPHPDVSSSSIRKRRIAAKKLGDQFLKGSESDAGQQIQWFGQGAQGEFHSGQQEYGTAPVQSDTGGRSAFQWWRFGSSYSL
eukprot:TRINITY_DN7153_c0_g3_i1.p1 TRINITY_DN7153_c0_g3~~TRINITY_DN7153_c0_g3_i1.p1  ORF type:complete len:237 (-),score=8.37 TRINITY_DN7153_c0_g3_i1:122-832(-)